MPGSIVTYPYLAHVTKALLSSKSLNEDEYVAPGAY